MLNMSLPNVRQTGSALSAVSIYFICSIFKPATIRPLMARCYVLLSFAENISRYSPELFILKTREHNAVQNVQF